MPGHVSRQIACASFAARLGRSRVDLGKGLPPGNPDSQNTGPGRLRCRAVLTGSRVPLRRSVWDFVASPCATPASAVDSRAVSGYRSVPVEDPSRPDVYGRPLVTAVRRQIDHEQAAIVRQIFELFTQGFSARWIASELNRLKVPSPGAALNRTVRRRDGLWLASAIAGSPRMGTGILNNDLYRGRYVWNRTKGCVTPRHADACHVCDLKLNGSCSRCLSCASLAMPSGRR